MKFHSNHIFFLLALQVGAQVDKEPGPPPAPVPAIAPAPIPAPDPVPVWTPPTEADFPLTEWSLQSFKTQPTFKPPVFEYERFGNTTPGYLFMPPMFQALQQDPKFKDVRPIQESAVIMTDTGELIWQSPTGEAQEEPDLCMIDGEIFIRYWEGLRIRSLMFNYGSIVFLDQSFTERYRVTLDFYRIPENRVPGISSHIDAHEGYVTSRGTVMVIAVNSTTYDLSSIGGPVDGWIRDNLIYEIDIKTNEILWSWSPLDHVDQLPLAWSTDRHVKRTGIDPKHGWDWVHFNSIIEFGRGIIISSRHTCTVYYIDKATGEIIWALRGQEGGDFLRLDEDALFCWQHTAKIVSSNDDEIEMTLHANNNIWEGGRNTTMGLHLVLNLRDMTFHTKRKFYDPDHIVWSWAEGSLQNLPNENVLMGHGKTSTVFEYDKDGKVLYRATFGYPNIDQAYRVSRHEFVGLPNTLPDVVACTMADGDTQVWMSWNGATEYTSWNVYCGGNPYLEASVPRTGFETSVILNCPFSVQVEAVLPSGETTKSNPLSLLAAPACTTEEEVVEQSQFVIGHRSHRQNLPRA